MNYKKALIFAARAHAGQRRRGGDAYIIHPIRVAASLKPEKHKVIALLHDCVEDTPATLDDIEVEFGYEIMAAVDCLTKRQGEPYARYITRILTNDDAIAVKIADICDNLGDTPTDKAVKRSSEALTRLLMHT